VGEQNGLNRTTAPNITENSQPHEFFLLYFHTLLAVIVQETNQYVQQDAQAKNKPNIPYFQQIHIKDLYAFLIVTVWMGHNHKPSMKLYWTNEKLYHVPFYSSVMPCDCFLTILKHSHFADGWNPPTRDRDGPNYDRLWKIRQIFYILNSNFSELYYPTEHMAVDEVIVKFKGKFVFQQYIPKKKKKCMRFGIKMYKLCDRSGNTYNMRVYLGKQRNVASTDVTPTHGTVLELVWKVGVGHKIFMDNYFTLPKLFSDLHHRKINACSTVRHKRKEMPPNFSPKHLCLCPGYGEI
jgi:hypothetical protein